LGSERKGRDTIRRLTECGFETVGGVFADAISTVQVERADATGNARRATLGVVRSTGDNRKRTHLTPATRDGMERVRAYPVTPPTIHRVPIIYAGTADWQSREQR
jgi:hypothetical protein